MSCCRHQTPNPGDRFGAGEFRYHLGNLQTQQFLLAGGEAGAGVRLGIQDSPGGVMPHHGIGELVDMFVQASPAWLVLTDRDKKNSNSSLSLANTGLPVSSRMG